MRNERTGKNAGATDISDCVSSAGTTAAAASLIDLPAFVTDHLAKGQGRKIEECSGFCAWLFRAVERAAEDLCASWDTTPLLSYIDPSRIDYGDAPPFNIEGETRHQVDTNKREGP
jgi:hypothetical protein